MNWELSEASKSTYNQSAGLNQVSSDRDAQRDLTGGGWDLMTAHATFNKDYNAFQEFFGYEDYQITLSTVVGINANKIGDVTEAILAYCKGIISEIERIQQDTDSTIAFKGEQIDAALKTYMTNVETYCINLVSQLRAYCAKLDDVKAQWTAATETMHDNITATSGSAFATGSEFVYNQSQPSSPGAAAGSSTSANSSAALL